VSNASSNDLKMLARESSGHWSGCSPEHPAYGLSAHDAPTRMEAAVRSRPRRPWATPTELSGVR